MFDVPGKDNMGGSSANRVTPSTPDHDLRLIKIDFDALYDDNNYGECVNCGETHVLCPYCGFCLKYCHDDYMCHLPYDPFDNLPSQKGANP